MKDYEGSFQSFMRQGIAIMKDMKVFLYIVVVQINNIYERSYLHNDSDKHFHSTLTNKICYCYTPPYRKRPSYLHKRYAQGHEGL